MSDTKLKAQLEVLHAEYQHKCLLFTELTKTNTLTEELCNVQRELIEAQNKHIAELKQHIEILTEMYETLQKICQKQVIN